MKHSICLYALLSLVVLASGCSMFRASIEDRDPADTKSLDVKYDYNDLNSWAEEVSGYLLSSPLGTAEGSAPILAPMGIQNRTTSHLDMQALSDSITSRLLGSGKVRLVNTSRRDDLLKEQGYQVANCPPAARVEIGKQLGARYMLTGSLSEIGAKSGREVRVSKKQDVFYQLTVELTDLETGEVLAQKPFQRLRRASWPLIGW